MGLPTGNTIPLSPARRLICDAMHASQQVPLVAIERHCNVAELIEARNKLEVKPSWFGVFTKAYAMVALERASLRQCYLSFPRPRLHQHACNVAAVAIARKIGQDDTVLSLQIRQPEKRLLSELNQLIHRARIEPFENFDEFRRLLLVCRLPRFARRFAWWAGLNVSGELRLRVAGTFGVTSVAALKSTLLSVLCPLTTTLVYGVFSAKGAVPIHLCFDHRVLDGVEAAKTLEELEHMLNGPILAEMRALSNQVRTAA